MQADRPGLTSQRIVEVCRELLVEGGPEAVVVREVARRLGVTAPALYKHAAGREDLLTLLIATCQDDVATVCAAARDACDPKDSPAQLLAATLAFRQWAVEHPREFALLYGQPLVGYSAPADGPTTASAQRFGVVFAGIYSQLLRDGRLRLPAAEDLPRGFVSTVQDNPLPGDQTLPLGAIYQFALGFQRMLGVVSVEVAGHLNWAMTDTASFVEHQLHELADQLILPEGGPDSH